MICTNAQTTLMSLSFKDMPERWRDNGGKESTRKTCNERGKITSRIDPVGRETRYEYAENGIDLIKVQQRTAKGWDTLEQITWNNNHRPLTIRDAAGRTTKYTWNATGQLTSQTNILNQTTRHECDDNGRLVKVTNLLGHAEATYTCDAAGNVATGTDSQGYTLYTWCGDTICQARDGNDQPIAYYFGEGTFRPEPNTPVSKFQGEREYYAKDQLGSVRDVLDQQGNVTASYDYDPYGKLTNSPVTPPEFGYAGMQYHGGSYLTTYRAYEPQTGRWLSRDPIEELGGYGYVGENPVSCIDMNGGIAVPVVIILGGLYVYSQQPSGGGGADGGLGTLMSGGSSSGSWYWVESRCSDKERAIDIPNWAKGKTRNLGESCDDFAKRLLREQYGCDNPRINKTGAASEFSQIKKNCERGGE
ncbi:MAG: hypothetical protein LBF50_11220 [Azoarcus sp.]|jgi:RHS repeat-associated protein|nr:hypothetical protein [Azoarcus sp.]